LFVEASGSPKPFLGVIVTVRSTPSPAPTPTPSMRSVAPETATVRFAVSPAATPDSPVSASTFDPRVRSSTSGWPLPFSSASVPVRSSPA
jgi:hypothetical protein